MTHSYSGTDLRFFEIFLHVVARDGRIGDKVEETFQRQHGHVFTPEKLVDVVAVFPQELQGVRMVHLDGLGNVDEENLALVVKHVELGQVGVDELRLLEHEAHHTQALRVQLPRFLFAQLHVLQERRRPTVGALISVAKRVGEREYR